MMRSTTQILSSPAATRARIATLAFAVTQPNCWQAISNDGSHKLPMEIMHIIGGKNTSALMKCLHVEDRAVLWRVQTALVLAAFHGSNAQLSAIEAADFLRTLKVRARNQLGIRACLAEVDEPLRYVPGLLSHFPPASKAGVGRFQLVISEGGFDMESIQKALQLLPTNHARALGLVL